MTQDEVNELVGRRDDAARAMLAALKRLTSPNAKPGRMSLSDWENAPSQIIGRAAIAQAEAAGIKGE